MAAARVRPQFAALLREPLGVRGVPRNEEKPGRFANFGLEPDDDRLLTRWMHEHLTLAVWTMPDDLPISRLEAIEVDVIRFWTPPLNLKNNPGRLRHLRMARAYLATEAKAWVLAAGRLRREAPPPGVDQASVSGIPERQDGHRIPRLKVSVRASSPLAAWASLAPTECSPASTTAKRRSESDLGRHDARYQRRGQCGVRN